MSGMGESTVEPKRAATAARRYRSLQDPEALRELVQRLHEGIYITNRAGEILDANPAFLRMFGIASLDALRARAAELLVDPEQRLKEIELLDRLGAVREYELQIRRLDGQIRTVLDTALALTDPQTGEQYYQGILVDITERKRLEEQLLEQSIRDPLTGSYNRRYLAEFEQAMNARGKGWGCIVLDIDHFKEYNDRYGHKFGDEVLTRIARFLMRQTRVEEGVVRLGGDEFVVLLADSTDKATEQAAQRLKSHGGREVPVEFSLGWAVRTKGEPLERTIDRADESLLAVRFTERPLNEDRRR